MENKQLDSCENIYDKLNTKDAKNIIIKHLDYINHNIFEDINDIKDRLTIPYLTSRYDSFKFIIKEYRKQKDKEIPFKLFNPHILWEELTNVASDISKNFYREIFNTLDKDFITKQLNNSSISLRSFKNLLENYKNSFLNKINIEGLKNEEMKSLIQNSKKTDKRTKNEIRKNKLKRYINQHSKIDEIDKSIINRYPVQDLLDIKDSIKNIELYIEILNMRKYSAGNIKNRLAIENLITELKAKLLDTYNHERYFSQ